MDKIERQKANMANLLLLIKQNPDIEILPMVDSEIVCDEGRMYWLGHWHKAMIDEYWVDDEKIHFKSWDFDSICDEINDSLDESETQGLSYEEIDKLVEQKADALPWKRAIVVMITTP